MTENTHQNMSGRDIERRLRQDAKPRHALINRQDYPVCEYQARRGRGGKRHRHGYWLGWGAALTAAMVAIVVLLNWPDAATRTPQPPQTPDTLAGQPDDAGASPWTRVGSALQSQAAAPIEHVTRLPRGVAALPEAVSRSAAAVQSPMVAEWRALASDIRDATQAFLQAAPDEQDEAIKPGDTSGPTSARPGTRNGSA